MLKLKKKKQVVEQVNGNNLKKLFFKNTGNGIFVTIYFPALANISFYKVAFLVRELLLQVHKFLTKQR